MIEKFSDAELKQILTELNIPTANKKKYMQRTNRRVKSLMEK